jgi:hypothetical protein
MSTLRCWLLGIACVGLTTALAIETVRMRAMEREVSRIAAVAPARGIMCLVLRSWLERLPATSFHYAKSSDAQALADDEYTVLASRPILESCGVEYAPLESVLENSYGCGVLAEGNFSCATRAISRVLDAYPRPAQLPTAQ